MHKYVKECVAYCLNKRIRKCSLKLSFSRLIKWCFRLYIAAVIYLSLINTIILNNFDFYIRFIFYTAVILIGSGLFFLSEWMDISWKHFSLSQIQYCDKIFPEFRFISKIIAVKFCVIVLKIITAALLFLPASAFLVIIIFMLQRGVSVRILLVCFAGLLAASVAGLIASVIIFKRYFLAEYCALIDYNGGVGSAIKSSIYLMDSKCGKLLKYKIYNSNSALIGFILPGFRVKKYLREIFYITDKTTEYARKLHTPNKAVVFYFNDITA